MGKYDVAIIGAGLAGLSIAARVSRRGKRVVIFEPSAAMGGVSADIAVDGTRFTPGPAGIFGFEPGGPLRTLCSEFGISLKLSQDVKGYQVVLPDRRVTVFPERDRTIEEMRRGFPREIDSIEKLYRSLHALADTTAKNRMKAYLSRRRSAADYLRPYRPSRELAAFFNVQSLIFFGTPLSRVRLDSLIRMATSFPLAAHEGVSGIASKLGKVISGSGGSFRMEEPWPEMLIHAKRITGIATKTGNLEVKSVVLNTLEWGSERRWFLAIRPEVIPVGMRNTAICLPDYNKPFNIFTMTLAEEEKLRGTAESSRSLRVVFHGAEHGTHSEALLDRVSSVIPFLRDFIVSGGEEDLAMLTYPGQEGHAQDLSGSRENSFAGTTMGLKNLFFIPDRYPDIGQSIMESQRLLKRIP